MLVGVLVLCTVTQASLYTNNVNTAIPDGGGGLTTLSSTITVSGANTSLSDLNVYLNISSTANWNGDLYGYLRGPGGLSGPIAILLNRVGSTSGNSFGYIDLGFVIELDDSAVNGDVHLYTPNNTSSAVTGIWQPDARYVDPATVTDQSARTAYLSAFNGINPNGTWTLVFSDFVTSGSPSTLVGWSLDITAVPEPVNVALGIFGVLAAGFGLGRRFCARSRQ
jgi:subtilisin-like proprotein convertase family protein